MTTFIIIINFNEWFPSEINKGTGNLGVIQTLPIGALLTGRRKDQHFTAGFIGGFLIVFICQKWESIPSCAGQIGSLVPQSWKWTSLNLHSVSDFAPIEQL